MKHKKKSGEIIFSLNTKIEPTAKLTLLQISAVLCSYEDIFTCNINGLLDGIVGLHSVIEG